MRVGGISNSLRYRYAPFISGIPVPKNTILRTAPQHWLRTYFSNICDNSEAELIEIDGKRRPFVN